MRMLVFALAVAAATPGFAADIVRPVAPPRVVVPVAYDWTGHYLGLHAGYFSGHAGVQSDEGESAGPVTGWIVGGLAGFNVLHNAHILGLEADAGWSNASGHGSARIDLYNYDLKWTAPRPARLRAPVGGNPPFFPGGGG